MNYCSYFIKDKALFGSYPSLERAQELYSNNVKVFVDLTTDDGTGSTATYLHCDGSTGEVKLHHYGSEKFATKSTGVAITGILQGASDAEIKTSPIRIHSNTISTNTTVASNENAVSGGPVTIANGVTVTVSGDWTVV